MENLTALERELLHSVSALKTGIDKEIVALKSSLTDYDTSATKNIVQRLMAIENEQEILHQRLQQVEQQQNATAKQITGYLSDFATRLSSYEQAVSNLNSTLSRLTVK